MLWPIFHTGHYSMTPIYRVLQIPLQLDPQGIDNIIVSFTSWRSRLWKGQGYPAG